MSKSVNGDDEIGEQTNCDNCGYPTTRLKKYQKYNNEEYMLCGICYGTFLGHATIYPNQVSDVKLYQSIAHVTNIILDEIESLKNDKSN